MNPDFSEDTEVKKAETGSITMQCPGCQSITKIECDPTQAFKETMAFWVHKGMAMCDCGVILTYIGILNFSTIRPDETGGSAPVEVKQ